MGQTSIRDHQAAVSDRRANSVRLDSWKEIASYLHRDARTVRRWERERRLPVHRVPGGERSGVFAYVSELEHWLRASDVPSADPSAERPRDEATSPSVMAFENPPPAEPVAAFSATTQSADSASIPVVDKSVTEPAFLQATISQPASHRDSPPLKIPSKSVDAAFLHGASSQLAFYGMAFLLLLSITAGSAFAFVHYRRFHQPAVANARPSPEAQELYLRGRYSWNLRTEDGLNQAIDLFTQSIVNDPHYAPAYAGLADSYLLLRQYGHMPDSEAYPRALAAARQAVLLDPSCPDAHRSIAFVVRFWNWDMPAAEREYLRAIELDPRNSQSHHWYATALLSSGRVNEALTQIDLARSLEPQSVSVLADRGYILSYQDSERGIEALKQVAQSQPEFPSTHRYLSEIYLDHGNYSGFIEESSTSATLAHEAVKSAHLDRASRDLAASGPAVMLRNLAASYATLADRGQSSPYLTARLFGLVGDSAQAIHYLQIAYDRHDPGFLTVEGDKAFENVRSSPEYMTLLTRRDAAPDGRRQPVAQLDRLPPF